MLTYRKELDGLRALAVVAVIFYHANLEAFGFQLFKGGFFGVDVFLVLSGYLITGIIRNNMAQGTFTFSDFYWRRAKRIVPALLVMLTVTSTVAYFILLPDDLITYANSLRSALYFGSNHFFFGEDSYAATSSIYRPLLHTWSLGIEWQFYLIFPVIVWFINRVFHKYLFGVLICLMLLSLQYASYIVKVNPDAAFYLLPARVWELIIGGLATFYNRDGIRQAKEGSIESFIYRLLPLLGLFMIIHSILFIGHESQHPSFITLVPVLGTCLFIMFSHKGEVSSDFLSIKPIVSIGLISYSLYLWHQPVFVFFRLLKHDYFRHEQFLLLVIISTILATLTYRFVESRYRTRNLGIIKTGWLVALLFGCYTFSYAVIIEKGFPQRLGNLVTLFENLENKTYEFQGKRCHGQFFENRCKLVGSTDRNIILIGNSHGGDIGRNVLQLSKLNGWSYSQVTTGGCPAINTVKVRNKQGIVNKACVNESNKIAHYLEDNNSPRYTIIYYARLPSGLNNKQFTEDDPNALIGSINDLSVKENITNKLNLWHDLGHEIIIVYSNPHFYVDVPKHIAKLLSRYPALIREEAYQDLTVTIPFTKYQEVTKDDFSIYDNVRGNNISRVYPHEVFCNSKVCFANDEDRIYFGDSNHLSTHGADLLMEKISVKLFRE
ncbi:acyltransferase [Vibrio kyushuensis]|uniref:acyltransferase family protein n=1 Tax=Vibrio kyushuensis TaxID=2910249 RepID=UPI003D0F7410